MRPFLFLVSVMILVGTVSALELPTTVSGKVVWHGLKHGWSWVVEMASETFKKNVLPLWNTTNV